MDPRSKPQKFKELLRPALIRARTSSMKVLARVPFRGSYEIVHVLGCGRSGTTIIGNAIGLDKDILYLNEPYYYWYNVSSRTDFGNLLGKDGVCWLTPRDVKPPQRQRARRMLATLSALRRKRYVVEKTPINSLRVDWLLALDPSARFVVINRSWVDIVNSIVDLTANKRYYLAGRPDFHPWWGEKRQKIYALLDRDPFGLVTPAFRAFVEERLLAGEFQTVDLNMAVFEAMACQVAIDRSRACRSARDEAFLDIDYDRFVEKPDAEVSRALIWIKHGSLPKTPKGAFSEVKRRPKKNPLAEAEILAAIHRDLRDKAKKFFDK